jgi:hypothetical protein
VSGKSAEWCGDPAAWLQHLCCSYWPISRIGSDPTRISMLFQILEKSTTKPKDLSMLQPGRSITAALGFDGKT